MGHLPVCRTGASEMGGSPIVIGAYGLGLDPGLGKMLKLRGDPFKRIAVSAAFPGCAVLSHPHLGL